jgi:aspartyl-tRNA(Asn)/glutamyl-tRNA(Gln) amidotransferase subunit A
VTAVLAQLARAYSGGLDPVAVAEVCVTRARRNVANAFITETQGRAQWEALASRARHRTGASIGLLDGAPIVYKDVFDLAGTRTTAGSKTLIAAAPAEVDSEAVARCSSGGAVSIGKTNMSEFAFSALGINPVFGTPVSPDWPSLIPGGSSSGTAVAVAAGIAACGLGSDTSGSVRVPAAFNGLVGFRPSRNRYPEAGVFPLAPTLDTVGTLAHGVEDIVALDTLLRTGSQTLTKSLLDAPLVVPTEGLTDGLDDTVRSDFSRALDVLDAAGFALNVAPVPVLTRAHAAMDEYGTVVAAEAVRRHRRFLDEPQSATEVDPRIIERLRRAAARSPADYERLMALRRSLMSGIDTGEDTGFVLSPTVKFVAPRLTDLARDPEKFAHVNEVTMHNTRLFSFLDLPALALPCPRTQGTPPTSLMIAGPPRSDAALLSIAGRIESTLRAADDPLVMSPATRFFAMLDAAGRELGQ